MTTVLERAPIPCAPSTALVGVELAPMVQRRLRIFLVLFSLLGLACGGGAKAPSAREASARRELERGSPSNETAGSTSTTAETAPSATVFRIQALRPIEELRREALAAQPPVEEGLESPDLVELAPMDATIKLDIRYATTNNFLGTKIYDEPRAFLQRPAAQALLRAHRTLAKQGYGVLIHDAYRPWHVTKIFWDATPEDKHTFVANPAHGSRHNRGCAVDLTLYDLESGAVIEMPSAYDEMSDRARPSYTGGTAEQRRTRDVLRAAMEAEGFVVYEVEWWHFDYKDWRRYPVGNITFDKIGR